MTLLRDIQNAAASTESRVADLLRKCKILAARLKSNELNQWVDRELNGYTNKNDLQDYRKLKHVESYGYFTGPFGAVLDNAPIPSLSIPERHRDFTENEYFISGVTVYEDLLNTCDNSSDSDKGTFQVNWPPDLVVMVGQNIYADMNCLKAWKMIPRGTIVGLLDAVRNKILGFALDIEKENPQAGEADVNSTPVPEPVVSQTFHSHFYGEVGNVATGSHHVEQHTTFNQLWRQANIDLLQLSKELPTLRSALISEAKEPDHYEAISAVRSAEIEAEKKDGPKALGYLSKVGRWGLDVATKIGTPIAVEAIKHALGMQS